MSVSSTDMAQLPGAPPVPPLAVMVPDPHPKAQPVDRRVLREVRRHERRRRRLSTLAGLAVLAAFLFATVVVLDMVR